MADRIRKTIEVTTDASSSLREFDRLDQSAKRTLSDLMRLNEDINKTLIYQSELMERIIRLEEGRGQTISQNAAYMGPNSRLRMVGGGYSGSGIVHNHYYSDGSNRDIIAPQRSGLGFSGLVGNIFGGTGVMGGIGGIAGGLFGGAVAGLGLGALTSVMAFIVSSLREGENLQKSFKELDSVVKGISPTLHRMGQHIGYTDAELAAFTKKFVEITGQVNEAGSRSIKMLEYEKAFGIDTSRSLQLGAVSRMTQTSFENEFGMLFKSLSRSGTIDPQSRNFALFNEKLENLVKLITFQGQRLYQPSGSMASNVIGAFDLLGGSFADQRQVERIKTISEAISNPQNDFKRAFVIEQMVSNLSMQGKNTDFVSIMEQMEKGIFGQGNLRSIFSGIKERYGTGNEGIIAMQGFTGLGWNESRKLTETLNSPEAEKFYSALEQYSETEAGSKERAELESQIMNEFGIDVKKMAANNTTFVEQLGATLKNTLSEIGSNFIKQLSEILDPKILSKFGDEIAKFINEDIVNKFFGSVMDFGRFIDEAMKILKPDEWNMKESLKKGYVTNEEVKAKFLQDQAKNSIWGNNTFGRFITGATWGLTGLIAPEYLKEQLGNTSKEMYEQMEIGRFDELESKRRQGKLNKKEAWEYLSQISKGRTDEEVKEQIKGDKTLEKVFNDMVKANATYEQTITKHKDLLEKHDDTWKSVIVPKFTESVGLFREAAYQMQYNLQLQRYEQEKELFERSGSVGPYKPPPKQVLSEEREKYRQYAYKLIKELYPEWIGQEDALDALVMSESGWNPYADNPESSAYGIGQFLDKTWGLFGAKKTDDPYEQIRLMLKYIKRGGGSGTSFYDPKSAWEFKKKNNYYGLGGLTPGGQGEIVGGVHGKEFVVPYPQSIENYALLEGIRSGAIKSYSDGGWVEEQEWHSYLNPLEGLKKIAGRFLTNQKIPYSYTLFGRYGMSTNIFDALSSTFLDKRSWSFEMDPMNGIPPDALKVRDLLNRRMYNLDRNWGSEIENVFISMGDKHLKFNPNSEIAVEFINEVNDMLKMNLYGFNMSELNHTVLGHLGWSSMNEEMLGSMISKWSAFYYDPWDFALKKDESVFNSWNNFGRKIADVISDPYIISGIANTITLDNNVEAILGLYGEEQKQYAVKDYMKRKKENWAKNVGKFGSMKIPNFKTGGWTGAGGLVNLHGNEFILSSDVFSRNRDLVFDMVKGDINYNSIQNTSSYNSVNNGNYEELARVFKEIVTALMYEKQESDNINRNINKMNFVEKVSLNYGSLNGIN